jgi:hypothetical protein
MAEYLHRDQAARYLRDHYGFKISAQTLAVYACRGRGPLYRLAGRNAVYETPSLDAWAAERLSPLVRSTAEMRGTV